MSSTYVKKRCGKCGYTVSKRVQGTYRPEPIGVPFTRCPACGTITHEKERKEWIQMSYLGKYFAIFPKGLLYAVVIVAVLFAISSNILLPVFENISEDLFGVAMLSLFAGVTVLLHFFMTMVAVNGMRFVNLYKSSVARTRNAEYRKLLESVGKIYDEKLPFGLRFSEYEKRQIEYELSKVPEKLELVIPSLRIE